MEEESSVGRAARGQEGLAEITGADRWVCRNPFAPARPGDDEIAVATCQARVESYAGGGPGHCSLGAAMRDQEPALRTAQAWSAGRRVRVEARAGPAGRRRTAAE